MQLDDVDQRIIRLLRVDGRISNTRLAAEVRLSQSACLRRLQRLERAGVIQGYTALLNEELVGRTTVILVQITLERQTADYLSRFEHAVKKCPDVYDCYLISGASDYILRVEARDAADFERIHDEQLSRLPGISRIESRFTIRRVVQRTSACAIR